MRHRKGHGKMCFLSISFDATDMWGRVGLFLRHLHDPEIAKTEMLFTAERWDSRMKIDAKRHVQIRKKNYLIAAWLKIGESRVVSWSRRTTECGDAHSDVDDERMINMLEAFAAGELAVIGFRFAGDQERHVVQLANSMHGEYARDLRGQISAWKRNRALLKMS
jgi:hypothetical protein